MNCRKCIITGLLILFASVLIPLFAWSMLSTGSVEDFFNRQLLASGTSMHAERFITAFPFRIVVNSVTLNELESKKPLIKIDHLSVRLRLQPLFVGRVAFIAEGKSGSAMLSAEVNIYPAKSGKLKIRDLSLETIPFVSKAFNSKIKGLANLDFQYSQNKNETAGEARLKIDSLRLQGASFGALSLPDIKIPETRGVLKLEGNNLVINSLAMQGDDIYLRTSGTIQINSPLPISLITEIMPKAESMERNKSIFLMMAPYQAAPAVFRLKIRGTLANPVFAE